MTYNVARAVMTSGSAHDDVHTLGAILHALGQPTSVSAGENPFGIVDESIIRAVNAVRSAHSIPAEDAIPGVPEEQRSRWIGPVFWGHLLTPAGHVKLKLTDDAPAQ